MVTYFEMGPFHVHVGFTQNPDAFKREVKRMKVGEDVPFLLNDRADATCHHFTKDGKLTAIICMPKTDHSMEQICALVVHEAVHVKQEFFELIGEHVIGRETEAYFVQYVTQGCLGVVAKNRDPKRKVLL